MPSLAPFGQAVSEEKIFLTLANQKKELILDNWTRFSPNLLQVKGRFPVKFVFFSNILMKSNIYDLIGIRRYKNLFAKILDKSTILTGSLPVQS
jgi:hypothetical protein